MHDILLPPSRAISFYDLALALQAIMASDDAMEVEASLPSSPYMDVDSRQHGSASQSIITAAIDEARHAVISFLRMRKAEDIVPTNSRVVMVDSTVRLRHAFRALLDNGMYRIPPRACTMTRL